MRMTHKIAAAALLGASAFAFTVTGASAKIVCNAQGDCWHATTEYKYEPSAGVKVYNDDWKWKEGDRFRWREHEGRGYWKGENWTEF
jgi:hypothetical protein